VSGHTGGLLASHRGNTTRAGAAVTWHARSLGRAA
jgi:hypothetical protein